MRTPSHTRVLRGSRLAATVMVAGLIAATLSTAIAVGSGTYEARWDMRTSWLDATGQGHDARLDPLMPGVSIRSGSWTDFNDHGRLLVSPSADLSPGTGDIVLGMRLATTDEHANLLQAGTSGPGKHVVKLELANNPARTVQGVPRCQFSGSLKTQHLAAATPITDGRWHWLECAKVGTRLEVRVDGCVVVSKRSAVGEINVADKTWTIGAKPTSGAASTGDSLLGKVTDAFVSRAALPPAQTCPSP